MQDSLNDVWDSWKRSSQEESISVIDRNLVPPVNNALIFRFASKKSIGVKDLGAALNSIWKPTAPVNVYAIGEGIYLVGFENVVDCNRVLARQPWLLSNNLMIFKKVVGNEKISDLVLNEVPFWVQIHGLEIQLLTRYVGEILGNKVGRVLEVDCSANSIAWGKCLRVRVLINVTKPLVRGTKVDFNGCTSVVIFRYEKLCDFCYLCGRLDHIDRDCPNLFANDYDLSREVKQFEPWLKADGLKGVPLEELSKGAINRGKQVVFEQNENPSEGMEFAMGEEMTVRVMQFEGPQNPMNGNESNVMEPMGGMVLDPRFSGSIDSLFQSAGMGTNRFWNAAGAFQPNLVNPMGISMGPFLNNQMEPYYQLNNNQQWVNTSTRGLTPSPMDACNNFLLPNPQQPTNESIGVVNPEVPEGGLLIPIQPVKLGSEPVKSLIPKKGRRSGGQGKGKNKVTPTSNKATPKGIWIKRSSLALEGEQKAAKKLKGSILIEEEIVEASDNAKITDITESITEGNTEEPAKITEEVQEGVLKADKAESGEAQLRQEK